MKITKSTYVYLLATAIFLSACGPAKITDDSLKNVPEDVSSVTAFNIKQLLEKADLPFIQSLEFYKNGIEKLKKKDPILASIIEEPINSGIDLTKNFYFLVDVDPNYPKEKFYGFVLSIADLSLFETMLKQTKLGEFQKGDQFSFVIKRNNLLAWNETFALIGNGSRSFDVNKELARFFNRSPEQSISNNSDLKKCLSQDYDIATWVNSDFLAKNEDIKMSASLIGISEEALRANYFHFYLNFNERNITGNSKHFLQKELTNDLKLFFKDGIDQNVSKYIPADNLGMLVGAALDTKGLYQVVSEKIGGYTMANKALKEFGFNIKDISNAFSGDMVLGLYDNSDSNDSPEILIASSINDHDTFSKFIDLAKQLDVLEKQEENLYLIKDMETNLILSKSKRAAYLFIKDDLFFVSANESVIQTIKKGGYRSADQVDASIYNTIASNSFGSFIDLKNYRQLTIGLSRDQQIFTNVEMSADLKEANLKVEMVDKNMNSLKALFQLINEIYLSDKKTNVLPII